MLTRLERDAMRADLAAVEAPLHARTVDDDPVGHFQFSRRIEDLTQKLREIEGAPSTSAEIGLFFGGRPVVGSHGIQAEFGAKAVAEFQTLVSSAFAAAEGALGARGPVPQRDRTQLMLTDIARGSFGFILEQVEDAQLLESSLKTVITHAVDLVYRAASPDLETFENMADDVDTRVLGSLRSFFKLLDDAGATLRIIDDHREFTLRREEIELGKKRTEGAEFTETVETVEGRIYVLPEARRFELHLIDSGETLRGTISRECLAEMTDGGTEVRPGIIGTVRNVRLLVRDIRTLGVEGRKSYRLLGLAGPESLSLDDTHSE